MAKAKRKLTDINFEKEGAHIALTSKSQGYSANGHPYALVLKANNFSKEAIQKMQAIQVTMDVPSFLEKFFHLYGSDAQVLARMMGYVPPEDEAEVDNWEKEYEEYIQERLEAFTIIKSLHDAEDSLLALSALNENDYLAVLKAQEMFETLQKNSVVTTEEGSTEAVAKAKVSDEETVAEVEPSGVITNKLEKSMTEKVKDKAEEVKVEMVEKSALVDLQKALDENKAQLEKALASVAAFETAAKEAVVKAKTAEITAVVKNEKHVEAIAKAALSLESDEDFAALVSVLKEMNAAVDTSELFVEKGAAADEVVDTVKESPVAKAVKAQLAKTK